MIRLIFLEDDFSGQVHELTREKTTVGRTKPSHLVIPSNSVSAQHCEILVWGDDVIVRDLDSANGTFVDEVRLNKQSGVKSGQIIRFGLVKARLEIKPTEQDDTATELTAIYEHRRAVRAVEEEKLHPEPTSATLKSEALPVSDDQTVMLKKQPPHQPSSAPPQSEPRQIPIQEPSRSNWIVRAILALLGLGLLAWLAWFLFT